MQILESKERKELKYRLEIDDARRKFIIYRYARPKKKFMIKKNRDRR